MAQDQSNFVNFDISVIEGADGFLWVTANCDQGSVNALPVDPPELPAHHKGFKTPLAWLNEQVKFASAKRKNGLALGKVLTDFALGQPPVRRLFDQARGTALQNEQHVLLRLLGAPEHVAEWPWELMTDPSEPNRPLALAPDIQLARTPRVRRYPIRPAPIDPPLNLLVVLSNPLPPEGATHKDVEPFDLYEAKRHLTADLQPLVEAGLLRIVFEERPSIARLNQAIRTQRDGFHVVHYLGHGSKDGLLLEDGYGRGRFIPSEQFARIMGENQKLALMVFAGCETARSPDEARPGDWQRGLSIAHMAVQDAVPLVLGMQAVLPFRTERMFTRSFYQGLGAGHSVAKALRLARGAVWDGTDGRSATLDWAIPTLYSGGTDPGPLIDPNATAHPVVTKKSVHLRLSPQQQELRFVARYANLNRAVDLLSGRASERLLCVQGINARPEDVSSFLDRAMEELGPDIAKLTLSARDLIAAASKDDVTPEDALKRSLLWILKQSGADYDEKAKDEYFSDDVMIGLLGELRLAIALDHADELPEDSHVISIIRKIVERRSLVRVAIVHGQTLNPFNQSLNDTIWEPVPLHPLTWEEVWQWIKGQLPDLARRGKSTLFKVHDRLGDRLESWEALGHTVAGLPKLDDGRLISIADRVRKSPVQSAPLPSIFGTSQPEKEFAAYAWAQDSSDVYWPLVSGSDPFRQSHRPVRLTAAGPHTDGRDTEFLNALGNFAAAHDLMGNVGGNETETASVIAHSMPGGSPFSNEGSATSSDILRWIGEVVEAQIDILVCDFGSSARNRVITEALDGLISSGKLVFAAGGNSKEPTWPAWMGGVIAVGALHKDGTPAPYSMNFPEEGKPDIFAPQTLAGTKLEDWVANPDQNGTSYAVLYASAVAALVWASYRNLRAEDVRAVLLGDKTTQGIRTLNATRALDDVRALAITDVLERGEMELHRIISESGLPTRLALQTLDRLFKNGVLDRRMAENRQYFSYPNRLIDRYETLREQEPGADRTQQQEILLRDARRLAARGVLSVSDAALLWASGELGARILALATMYEQPEARRFADVLDGIRASRTAFEQYHAILVARLMVPNLSTEEQDQLVHALQQEMAGEKFDSERRHWASVVSEEVLSIKGP